MPGRSTAVPQQAKPVHNRPPGIQVAGPNAYLADMVIRRLDETTVNQIAAGEVVERPASVVKELVENALDAGATRIEIATAGGGKSLVRVIDNGHGMTAEDLALAVSRHCTSKLDGGLDAIATLGFRGEALPSIGSVARLTVRSRPAGGGEGAEIVVDGGAVTGPRPAACNRGTMVEVRDLFHATPARLKFMKGEQAENAAVSDVVRRIALAYPAVRFVLSGPDRSILDLAARDDDATGMASRLADVAGRDFIDNAIPFAAAKEGVSVTGLAGLPSFHRGAATHQFAYVNGRPVRDRQILGALRAAYADTLVRSRHPVAAVFIDIDPALVDVNVHPAKADVRFRDPGLVRALIISGIRRAIAEQGFRGSTRDAAGLAFAMRPAAPARPAPVPDWQAPLDRPIRSNGFGEAAQPSLDSWAPSARVQGAAETAGEVQAGHRLGAARAQLHDTYIVTQTQAGMVIVDQHAAHERLVLEALKAGFAAREALPSQLLLVPEIVDLDPERAARLCALAPALDRLGLSIEPFGPGGIAVRATPAILGETDATAIVNDLADMIDDMPDAAGTDDAVRLVGERIDAVASRIACHGSVRSGRRLGVEEMNALLRQMEATPGSGTCNHGRPTFIELRLDDIERLFGRR